MKHSSSLWQAAGFALTTLIGTFLHFLYDWTGQNLPTAPFSAINESTWEHMKLMFWPLLFVALAQRPFFPSQRNYWCVKLLQILVGLTLIPVLFYTLNGCFGKTPDWVNISIFYLTAAAVFILERRLFRRDFPQCRHPRLAFAAICLIGLLFGIFTFAPPEIPLFQDPIDGSFGLTVFSP